MLIDQIEWIRAQLQLMREGSADRAAAEEIRQAGATLEAELIDLEMRLFDVRLTGGSAQQDTLRWARRLYARLTSLAGYIAGTDDRPTDQSREVLEMLRSELGDYQRQMTAIREDLATVQQAPGRPGDRPDHPRLGLAAPFLASGRGEESTVLLLASASLHRLRRRTVLRRTIDPSTSSVFLWSRAPPARAWGGFGG